MLKVSTVLLIAFLSLSRPAFAERQLRQVADAVAARRSPPPPPPSSPAPSSSAPTNTSGTTNSTASLVALSNAVAASTAAAAVPTSASFAQFPFLPQKFNPTVQNTDTGASQTTTDASGVSRATVSPETTANTAVAASSPSTFVGKSGTGFTLGGKPWWAAGSNGYMLGLISDGTTYGFTDAAVASYFQGQKAQGLNAIRWWSFINGNGQSVSTYTQGRAAQISPGVYNETVLRRFDRVIYYAGVYNIKLICTLSNYLPELGGAQWYVDAVLSGTATNPTYQSGGSITQWYTSQPVITAFENWISTLLNRVNTYTGRAYKNEPAIMAWELCNEPEYTYGGDTTGKTINTWISTISAYIKSIDKNHLVTTGEEGFAINGPTTNTGTVANTDGSCNPCDSNTNGAASANPFAIYHNFVNAGVKGLDFMGNLALSTIDFGTVHAYPQAFGIPFSNMGDYDNYTWINQYFIASRAAMAKTVGKPIILEEFGTIPQGTQQTSVPSTYSDNYGLNIVQQPRSLVYGSMLATAATNGYSGAFPWEVYPFAPSGAAFGPSTITFQWGSDGSTALWAWGNYTAAAISAGSTSRAYVRPVGEPDLISGQKYSYCNKGQSPTLAGAVDCDVGFGSSGNCSTLAQQAYNCSPGAFYQYVRCQATCNPTATPAG